MSFSDAGAGYTYYGRILQRRVRRTRVSQNCTVCLLEYCSCAGVCVCLTHVLWPVNARSPTTTPHTDS